MTFKLTNHSVKTLMIIYVVVVLISPTTREGGGINVSFLCPLLVGL